MVIDVAEVFPIVRDHRLSVREYIDRCNFRKVGDFIQRANFEMTDQDDRQVRWDIVVDHLGQLPLTSEEYLHNECTPHFDAGDIMHLLPLAATISTIGTRFVTVALGTVVPGPKGPLVFGIVPAEGGQRDLELIPYNFHWRQGCSLIKVRAFRKRRNLA